MPQIDIELLITYKSATSQSLNKSFDLVIERKKE
jgi:hypothetical protein